MGTPPVHCSVGCIQRLPQSPAPSLSLSKAEAFGECLPHPCYPSWLHLSLSLPLFSLLPPTFPFSLSPHPPTLFLDLSPHSSLDPHPLPFADKTGGDPAIGSPAKWLLSP